MCECLGGWASKKQNPKGGGDHCLSEDGGVTSPRHGHLSQGQSQVKWGKRWVSLAPLVPVGSLHQRLGGNSDLWCCLPWHGHPSPGRIAWMGCLTPYPCHTQSPHANPPAGVHSNPQRHQQICQGRPGRSQKVPWQSAAYQQRRVPLLTEPRIAATWGWRDPPYKFQPFTPGKCYNHHHLQGSQQGPLPEPTTAQNGPKMSKKRASCVSDTFSGTPK